MYSVLWRWRQYRGSACVSCWRHVMMTLCFVLSSTPSMICWRVRTRRTKTKLTHLTSENCTSTCRITTVTGCSVNVWLVQCGIVTPNMSSSLFTELVFVPPCQVKKVRQFQKDVRISIACKQDLSAVLCFLLVCFYYSMFSHMRCIRQLHH